MTTMAAPRTVDELLPLAAQGDRQAIGELVEMHRTRLKSMVSLRLDRRLYGRIGASDIVQDALIEAARRMGDYARSPSMDFYLWLRQLATQKLIDAHRHHLGAQKRSVQQEVSLYRSALPEASSAGLANQL